MEISVLCKSRGSAPLPLHPLKTVGNKALVSAWTHKPDGAARAAAGVFILLALIGLASCARDAFGAR